MRLQSPLRHPRSLTTPNTNENLLAGIRALAPEITARAAEIEAARRIPSDLVDQLRSIGMFRIFVPSSHDGLELPLAEGLEVIAAFARLDGSLGWTSMVACAGSLFATLTQRETYDRIYQNGPDVAICGSSLRPERQSLRATVFGSTADGRSPAAASTPIGWALSVGSSRTANRSPARTGDR